MTMIGILQRLVLELFALCVLSAAVEALLQEAHSIAALRAVFGLSMALCVVRVLVEMMR